MSSLHSPPPLIPIFPINDSEESEDDETDSQESNSPPLLLKCEQNNHQLHRNEMMVEVAEKLSLLENRLSTNEPISSSISRDSKKKRNCSKLPSTCKRPKTKRKIQKYNRRTKAFLIKEIKWRDGVIFNELHKIRKVLTQLQASELLVKGQSKCSNSAICQSKHPNDTHELTAIQLTHSDDNQTQRGDMLATESQGLLCKVENRGQLQEEEELITASTTPVDLESSTSSCQEISYTLDQKVFDVSSASTTDDELSLVDCPSATDEPRDDKLNATTLTSQMGRQTETFRSYSESSQSNSQSDSHPSPLHTAEFFDPDFQLDFNGDDSFENYGLLPLNEDYLDKLADNVNCSTFVGRLVMAAFPEHYFQSHTFKDITSDQLKRLYDMVAARYSAIKRRNKPAVSLSLSGVKSIIRTKIVNFRNTLNGYVDSCRPSVTKVCNLNNAVDQDGLIPLTEEKLESLSYNASCVQFIGRLVVAAFPNDYFFGKTFHDVTDRQLSRLYGMVSARYSEIQRANLPSFPLSRRGVEYVIRQKINGLAIRIPEDEEPRDDPFRSLSDEKIKRLARGASCVRFIGKLVLNSFPKDYFVTNTFQAITSSQLNRIYETVSARYSEIQRRNQPAFPLSLSAVAAVIRQRIVNLRARVKY